MRRLAHSRFRIALALVPLLMCAQPVGMQRKGEVFEKDFYGNLRAFRRLRVFAHGPVTLEAAVAPNISYSVRVSVRARTESEARQVIQRYMVRAEYDNDTATITAPNGPIISTVVIKAPHLDFASISTSDGDVEATGVDGMLTVDTGAGSLVIDRVRGDCRLATGGGAVRIGSIGGTLRCTNQAGTITVGDVKGDAVLKTFGGDIEAAEIKGSTTAETGAGSIHIKRCGAGVNASTVGGRIIVDQAGGIVTARNQAGPVRVGAAGGVQCESGSGGVRIANIAGPMHVQTSLGNIMAMIVGARLADSFLATANGDISVTIPSNVGVNIRAQNDMADTVRRILSDYNSVTVRREGRRLVAEGQVNGGGPLLQLSAVAGTIFIRRQP